MVNRDGRTPRVYVPLDPREEGRTWVHAADTGLRPKYPATFTATDGSRWELWLDKDKTHIYRRYE